MPSYEGLRRKFKQDVCGGRNIYQMLAVTNTGTGLGAANYRVGMCVLDSAANDWFLCTATAGNGTWVKVFG